MEIAQEELAFERKVPQLVWRGVIEQGPIRAKLVEVSQGKNWSNVKGMQWLGRGGSEGGTDEALSAWDQCNFQYLVYTEGDGSQIVLSRETNLVRRLLFRAVQVSAPMQ